MPKPGRIYVPLDVTFFEGDGASLSDEAQLLFIRMLARSKALASAGWLTSPQLSLCGRSVADSITELVDGGLVTQVSARYFIPSWPGWDRSGSESDGSSADGARANHVRWHERRGVVNTECGYCRSSQENPVGSSADSESESQSREEEKRVDKNGSDDPTPATSSRNRVAPASHPISARLRSWTVEHGFSDVDLEAEMAKCLDWHRANNRKRSDWDATFRNWLGNGRSYGTLTLLQSASRGTSSSALEYDPDAPSIFEGARS